MRNLQAAVETADAAQRCKRRPISPMLIDNLKTVDLRSAIHVDKLLQNFGSSYF